MTLQLAPDLILPDNFATEGVAVIGIRGSGKSNTEVRWFEVCYHAGIPCVTIDPKGDWGGIRSSADGKKPGLPVPVFGGLSGNFPLEEKLGKRIADLLVDENMSAVLDVSRLSIAARARFLTDFFNELIDRHQREPHVRCVIMEEAHRYIPQTVTGPIAALKEAASSILLEGRSWGLGCWAATQRPARLHKDVLEEVGTAIIHRIGVAATNDLKTIAGWVKHEDLGPEIVPSLTKLKNGEAWVLAPSTLGITKRVQIDRRTTFDSAATPLVGAGSRPIVTMADIDTDAITAALTDVIERAKADDPAELRKQITVLNEQIAALESAVPEPETIEVEHEIPVITEDDLIRLEELLDPVVGLVAHVQDLLTWETTVDGEMIQMVRVARERDGVSRRVATEVATSGTAKRTTGGTKQAPKPVKAQVTPPERVDTPAVNRSRQNATESRPIATIAKGERAVLIAVAERPNGCSRTQLTVLTGYKRSTRNAYIQRLSVAGYVTIDGDRIRVTDEGVAALGADYEPLPTGSALRDWYTTMLPEGERRIFVELVKVWPEGISRDELSDLTGYKTSTRNAYIQRLGVKEIVVVVNGQTVYVVDELFE